VWRIEGQNPSVFQTLPGGVLVFHSPAGYAGIVSSRWDWYRGTLVWADVLVCPVSGLKDQHDTSIVRSEAQGYEIVGVII
jgi:hypothetical protein